MIRPLTPHSGLQLSRGNDTRTRILSHTLQKFNTLLCLCHKTKASFVRDVQRELNGKHSHLTTKEHFTLSIQEQHKPRMKYLFCVCPPTTT